jgi:hypothetical protein
MPKNLRRHCSLLDGLQFATSKWSVSYSFLTLKVVRISITFTSICQIHETLSLLIGGHLIHLITSGIAGGLGHDGTTRTFNGCRMH